MIVLQRNSTVCMFELVFHFVNYFLRNRSSEKMDDLAFISGNALRDFADYRMVTSSSEVYKVRRCKISTIKF